VAEAERSSAEPPQPGDWRTSPGTGELEFFDGRDWVGAGPSEGDSGLLIRPAPAAGQAADDASGPQTGTD
jgi:hypothetical protein